MRKYSINYNCITFLIGCWLYSQYVRKDIKISNIQIFTGYYTIYKCKKFMNQLIELRFMTLAGKSYYITENISVILDEIKQSYDNTVYNLCNTHNIEL